MSGNTTEQTGERLSALLAAGRPDAPALLAPEEEIAVAVFEARRKGKGVMSHAFGGEGLDNAVRAGVR